MLYLCKHIIKLCLREQAFCKSSELLLLSPYEESGGCKTSILGRLWSNTNKACDIDEAIEDKEELLDGILMILMLYNQLQYFIGVRKQRKAFNLNTSSYRTLKSLVYSNTSTLEYVFRKCIRGDH